MIFNRSIKFPKANSFFLFGARGTGKTHLLKTRFKKESVFYLDLLDPERNERYTLRPRTLTEQLASLEPKVKWVVIDEIQKIPKLLDIVHQQIESTSLKFVMTGSSARKLRHGAANLLAGRAFVHHLFPLAVDEIGASFSLDQALAWGTLPRIFSLKTSEEKSDFLKAYAHTYLKEEITEEQVVRRLEPFRRFLFVAAQMSGQIINFSKIAREIGSTTPTVESYFEILEDTLVGILLEPFHESIRKRQRGNPKFYFFDMGLERALSQTLSVVLKPHTYAYGLAFEHFIVNEIWKLSNYKKKDYRLSYLRTKDGVEVDLIVERPNLKRALIEIKSSERISEDDVRSLERIAKDIPDSESFCFSKDSTARKIGSIQCLPWQRGLVEIGL